MDIEKIKMRVKHRLRMALPFFGGMAAFYFIARIIGLRHAFDLTGLVGSIFFLPFITFRYFRESIKVKK